MSNSDVKAKINLNELRTKRIPFVVLNSLSWHIRISDRLDAWLSTAKWKDTKSGMCGCGMVSLLKYYEAIKG